MKLNKILNPENGDSASFTLIVNIDMYIANQPQLYETSTCGRKYNLQQTSHPEPSTSSDGR